MDNQGVVHPHTPVPLDHDNDANSGNLQNTLMHPDDALHLMKEAAGNGGESRCLSRFTTRPVMSPLSTTRGGIRHDDQDAYARSLQKTMGAIVRTSQGTSWHGNIWSGYHMKTVNQTHTLPPVVQRAREKDRLAAMKQELSMMASPGRNTDSSMVGLRPPELAHQENQPRLSNSKAYSIATQTTPACPLRFMSCEPQQQKTQVMVESATPVQALGTCEPTTDVMALPPVSWGFDSGEVSQEGEDATLDGFRYAEWACWMLHFDNGLRQIFIRLIEHPS